MQNIDLICVGKLNAKYFAEGVAEYQKRLAAFASFRIVELPEEKIEEKNASDAVVKKALDKEGRAILGSVRRGAAIVALCIEGKQISSEELAQFLADRGVPQVDTIEFLNDWQVRSNNRSNPGLVRNYATHAGQCFDWMVDCLSGEDKASITIRQWPVSETYKKDHSGIKCWVGTANLGGFQSTVLQNCIDVAVANGGKVFYGTKGYLLIQDENGAVTGAYGQREDGFVQVNAAKGVILATGGYDANPELMEAWTRPEDYATSSWWNPGWGHDRRRSPAWACKVAPRWIRARSRS